MREYAACKDLKSDRRSTGLDVWGAAFDDVQLHSQAFPLFDVGTQGGMGATHAIGSLHSPLANCGRSVCAKTFSCDVATSAQEPIPSISNRGGS